MKRGFTLIELLIVISVMGILATNAYSHFGTYVNQVRTRSVSSSLHTVVSGVRMKTSSTERVHWLKLIGDTFHVYQDCDGDEQLTDNDKELGQYILDLPHGVGVEFTNSRAVLHGIKFSPSKMWWPAGSVVISSNEGLLNYKLTFPVNSQRVSFYEKVCGNYMRK